MDEPAERPPMRDEMSRRAMFRRIGAGAALAWAAPMIVASVSSRAVAGSGTPPSTGTACRAAPGPQPFFEVISCPGQPELTPEQIDATLRAQCQCEGNCSSGSACDAQITNVFIALARPNAPCFTGSGVELNGVLRIYVGDCLCECA